MGLGRMRITDLIKPLHLLSSETKGEKRRKHLKNVTCQWDVELKEHKGLHCSCIYTVFALVALVFGFFEFLKTYLFFALVYYWIYRNLFEIKEGWAWRVQNQPICHFVVAKGKPVRWPAAKILIYDAQIWAFFDFPKNQPGNSMWWARNVKYGAYW